MSKKRIFEPTTKYVGNTSIPRGVARWEWTKSKGLIVIYKDGLKCKCDWGTLSAFLTAVREGREGPVKEVTT